MEDLELKPGVRFTESGTQHKVIWEVKSNDGFMLSAVNTDSEDPNTCMSLVGRKLQEDCIIVK